MTITLSSLNGMVLVYLLCFSRAGAMVMLLPAIGDRAVPKTVRLVLALGIALVLAPAVSGAYAQSTPQNATALGVMVVREVLAGLSLGLIARIVVSALATAGSFIAQQTGLAMAMAFDPTTTADQGAVVGNFIALLGTVVVFATNLHYLAIGAISGSYHLIPPGTEIPVSDLAQLAIGNMSAAFALGFQLSAPFLVFGFVVNAAFGILSRLMPQMQIFFVVMPINIVIGFSLLALFLGTIMTLYLDFYSYRLGMLQ
jgi:flagellar biosynthesis protein FliR